MLSPPVARFAAAVVAVALLLAAGPRVAWAVTPESPEVKAVVGKSLKWLETQDEERLGGKCLIGLCFYKADKQAHAKVTAAQRACEAAISRADMEDNYSVGLALIFLCEVNAAQNRRLAEQYAAIILKRQKANGAWGYPGDERGDTSQTQYPTLGMWLASNQGIDIPNVAIERVCAYILRTQDPAGAWGYQGEDPGRFQRTNQSEVRPSLAAAGLGTLYICSDLLGITGKAQAGAGTEETRPAALRPVGEAAVPKGRRPYTTKAIDHPLARRAMADGNAWLQKNLHSDTTWFHYYLYALERYQSFREKAEDRDDPEPAWYNEMFVKLQKTQQEAGNWDGEDNAVVATGFATLFLLRSARKTISHLANSASEGVLLGGMGLPKNTADLRERDGKIVETPFAGTVDELIALISNPDHPDFAGLSDSTAAVALDADVTKRSGQIARLRAIVTGGTVESRLVAVRALGRVRELDNAPLLVFAMTSNDLRIVRAADQGLRFVSRKFGGVGLPDEPNAQDILAAIAAWKAWYTSIRPNAEFLD